MYRSRLPKIAAELGPILDGVEKATADLVAERAKGRVQVDTGRLRDAIHVEREDEGYAVVAGDSEAFYGHIVEHGGAHTPARPFLVPAGLDSVDDATALARAALRRLA